MKLSPLRDLICRILMALGPPCAQGLNLAPLLPESDGQPDLANLLKELWPSIFLLEDFSCSKALSCSSLSGVCSHSIHEGTILPDLVNFAPSKAPRVPHAQSSTTPKVLSPSRLCALPAIEVLSSLFKLATETSNSACTSPAWLYQPKSTSG
jgi:hypothetical protein